MVGGWVGGRVCVWVGGGGRRGSCRRAGKACDAEAGRICIQAMLDLGLGMQDGVLHIGRIVWCSVQPLGGGGTGPEAERSRRR